MSVSLAAARVYAKALFDIARPAGAEVAVADELHAVQAAFQGLDPVYRGFFELPMLRPADKAKVIDLAFAPRVSRTVLGLLHVLVAKRRELLLGTIVGCYDAMVDEHRGRVRASVTSARPLDRDIVDALRRTLEERTNSPVVLTQKVDAALIGGLRVNMGDVVLDGTLRRRLSDMRRALAASQG